MATVMHVPAGISEIHVSGRVYKPASDGTIQADPRDVQALGAAGFTLPIAPETFTTTGRPSTGNFAGRAAFDTTLNKPIWRNAANSGWVDATGTAV